MKVLILLLAAFVATAAAAKPAANAFEALQAAGGYDDFLAAAEAANLTKTLSDPALDATLLVPTDDAFDKVPKGTAVPAALLLYHAVPGSYNKSTLLDMVVATGRGSRFGGGNFTTLSGAPLNITKAQGKNGLTAFANGHEIELVGLEGGKTTIHSLSSVLTPPAPLAVPGNLTSAVEAAASAALANVSAALANATANVTTALPGAVAAAAKKSGAASVAASGLLMALAPVVVALL